MKTACYSICGPNVCSFFCSPSLSLSPIASAIFYSLLMFASFIFYIFQYFLHSHCVHGIGGPPIFICGLFFVHNLLNTCLELAVRHLLEVLRLVVQLWHDAEHLLLRPVRHVHEVCLEVLHASLLKRSDCLRIRCAHQPHDICEHYRQYHRLVVLFFLVFSKFLLDISSSRVKRWQTRFILS